MAGACLYEEPPQALVELLSARAEGVLLWVEELLAGLIDRGALWNRGNGWEVADERSVDVPLSFAQTVDERLAELSVEHRGVLEIAAVLGRDFDWAVLPGLAGVDATEVLQALSIAVDLQLIEEAGGERFRFRHALTAHAILERILVSQQSRLARRMLDALLAGSDPARDRLELLAHLAVEAGRNAQAALYLIEQARRALTAGALATAIADARRASRLVSADEPESRVAREVLLSALGQSGDAVAVEEVGGALIAEFDANRASTDRRARARLLLGQVCVRCARPDPGAGALRRGAGSRATRCGTADRAAVAPGRDRVRGEEYPILR
jgi:predicted ATPase